MKHIFIFLLAFIGVAQAQFAPTSAKTAFKNGVSVGTRDSTAYNAADSLVVVINRQGRMMYRSTDGYWKLLSNVAANDYVPYNGANANVFLGSNRIKADAFDLGIPSSSTDSTGRLRWNADDLTMNIGLTSSVVLQSGQEMLILVKNQTGATIPNGTVVRQSGVVGASGRLKVEPFLANGTHNSNQVLGLTTEDIPNGGDGFVAYFGKVRGLNTSAYPDSTILYASATVAGGLTDTVPEAPNNIVKIGTVVKSAASNGIVFTRVVAGSNINQDEGVQLTNPLNNSLLVYDSLTTLWKDKTLVEIGAVRVQDTAAMLNPYLRKSDTATMLVPFVQYSDTSNMLSPYRRTSTKITNSDLVNSTISGVSLGSNLNSLTAGNGLSGTAYNGSAAQTWQVDTSTISTKANVTGALAGYVTVSGTQTITGAKTFSSDITVNSMRVGLGGGSQTQNVALGLTSLNSNTTGAFNTSIGFQSLFDNTTAVNNTAVGSQSLANLTTGSNNIGIGVNAGSISAGAADLTTNTNSIFLGSNTKASANGNTNEIVIGDNTTGNGSNTVTIGNSSITNNYFTGNIRGGAFIRSGGTSSQFLKADGSVDGTSYATAASLSGYLPLSGGTLTGGLNGTSATFTGNGIFQGADDGTALFLKRTGGVNVMAINVNANGSFEFFDYAAGSFTSGLTQKNGRVGIGTTNPFSKTTISKVGVSAPTTADATNNAHLTLAGSDALVRLQFGTLNAGNFASYIQSTFDNGGGDNGVQPLALNPLGGAVSVGGALNGTSLSMSGIGLFNGAVDDGTNKLIVNGGVKANNSFQAFGYTNLPSTGSVIGMGFTGGVGYIQSWSNNAQAPISIDGSSFQVRLNNYATTALSLAATTGAATFSSSVTATGFFESSDLRLKNIVKRDGDVVYFNWKNGQDKNLHIGYIAQEVQKTNPDQVKADEKGMLSVNYTEVLVQKVRELEKQIAELQKRIK